MKSLLSSIIITFAAISALPALYQMAPQLAITKSAPQTFQLTWQSKNQRPVFLKSTPDLQAWADVTGTAGIIGDGGAKGITLTNTADKFFYRLREGAIRPGFTSSTLAANDDLGTDLVALRVSDCY